ncbi:MAG: TolC family protein [Candidatus Omnitrophica bacterium]|nr:TolC family protein [Candidatus Omnitrophota bacterium]
MKRLTKCMVAVFLLIFGYTSFVFAQGENKIFNLSLEEVTALALENNLDIQMAKYDAYIAGTALDMAKSIFDVILEAEINYQDDQSNKISSSTGTKTIDNDYNVGISKKFSSGTTVEVEMDNNRKWTDASSAISVLNYDSSLNIALEQELGKNFFGIKDRKNIDITKINIENSGYTSLEKIETVVSVIKKVYWDLVLQLKNVEIQKNMVDQAKQLYDLQQKKLKDGLVEMPDAIASEANYKNRVNNLILEKNFVKTKENLLKLLLNITEDNMVIIPTEDYHLDIVDQDFIESLRIAFDNRRDYLRAKNEIIARGISLVVEKNNNFPTINLAASLARNGLGDHFKRSVTNITSENNTNYSIGLIFSLPLENRDAKAKLEKAEYEKAKALVALKLVERKITIEIIDQVRDCNIYKEFALNSIDVAKLQAQKLEEEEKRFNLGRSNTDTIIRYQEDVILAEQSSVLAQYQLHSALVDLELKKGKILENYNLRVKL